MLLARHIVERKGGCAGQPFENMAVSMREGIELAGFDIENANDLAVQLDRHIQLALRCHHLHVVK